MNGFDEERFLEHQRWEERAAQEAIGEAAARAEYETYKAYVEPLEIENAQLKKKLERYREIFSVKGRGLTPEEEEFWSDVTKLQTREASFYGDIEHVVIGNLDKVYPIAVFFKSEQGEQIEQRYNRDGSYFSNLESPHDIIRKEVPNE